jgi:adenylate cyclase
MPHGLDLRISDKQQPVYSTECTGAISLGRRDKGDPDRLYVPTAVGGVTRIVIAPSSESTIPRAILIEPLETGGVRLLNRSTTAPLAIHGETPIEPLTERVMPLPVLLLFGSRAVRIQESTRSDDKLHHLPEATIAPGSHRSGTPLPPLAREAPTDCVTIVRWLQTVLDVVQGAAATDEFFSRAERAVIDSIGMDSGCVLLLDPNGDWRPHSRSTGNSPPSRGVLEQVRRERRTLWAIPKSGESQSLLGVTAVVAAPILNRAGEVIGALYGDRRGGGNPVSELEAVLVELLASGVAAGLARVEQERATLEAQVLFEQFFTPELAVRLRSDPAMLHGHSADVTVLFADVRGYSRVAERLGPAETTQWMREVLGELSGCVRAEGGVLIDYVGDELMALWGAPTAQDDHAGRAVRAAQAMLRKVPVLGKRWEQKVGEPLRIGVGAHSGPAWVGEVGTDHKFKYGPRGHTVNLASRVQGASKYLRVSGLMTGATQAALDESFPVRRLTAVRVVNIAAPVDLFEIVADPQPDWTGLRCGYEEALTAFESGDARTTARRLGNVLVDYRNDGPSLLLLKRAVDVLVSDATTYDPIWELPGK